MQAALDIDIAPREADPPATPALPQAAPAKPLPSVAAAATARAQAIDCGGLTVAVPFGWARSIVERFDISLVPNAPAWLVGAVNVDGRIVPLLDLAAWLDPKAAQAIDRHSKLLLGGEGEAAYALLFRGLPLLARHAGDAHDARPPGLPPALAEHTVGIAHIANDPDARPLPLVDAAALGRTWLAELAV